MRMLLLGLLLMASWSILAQVYVGNGAQVQLAGNVQLTLNDASLINNGTFTTGNSSIYFTGVTKSIIGGAMPVQFHALYINKSIGYGVVLDQPIRVSNSVHLVQGLADLNGHDLDLGSTGMLLGESENSRIIGTGGGEVLITSLLNAPASVNPGNLGATISSSKNIGSVTVRRGHRLLTLPGGKSILRYYTITPSNNSNLAAILRFGYFESELAGLSEQDLILWRSPDVAVWSGQGFTTRNAEQNYIEKTGIDAFSTWTLAMPSAALPVIFTGWRLDCVDGSVTLHWKTAQESNSSHFIVERNNGTGWIRLGQLPAAGNSSIEKAYVFIDDHPTGRDYYRIAQFDLDGEVTYTGQLLAACGVAGELRAWPNPFAQSFTLNIQSGVGGMALMRIINSAGVVISNKQLHLRSGFNQVHLDLQQAAAGVYQLHIVWPAGLQEKTLRMVKQ